MVLVQWLAALALLRLGACVVTEDDLKQQLGIDVNGLQEVSWKDWVNSNSQSAHRVAVETGTSCKSSSNATKKGYGSCCAQDGHCNEERNLICHQRLCNCKPGYFLNKNRTMCEDRPRKELGEPCVASQDNCHAAFATCRNGTCACKDDFVQMKNVCKPLDYDCPYKTPLIRNGVIWPCRVDNKINYCPKKYSCLTINDNARPKFLSPSGIEQSYCCPVVPNITAAQRSSQQHYLKIFADVCLYGKPYSRTADEGCPKGYFQSNGIGAGPVCCPEPCLPHPVSKPVVRDGRCTIS